MNCEYLKNTPLDEALSGYLDALRQAGFTRQTDSANVAEAYGRVTARAVYAKMCSPHYNSSAMDGIALRCELTFGATETTPVTLKPSDFTRVDTGDPLPEDSDCVIMIEDVVETGEKDGSVLLYQAAAPWQYVRQIGEDICEGDMLLPSFSEITPQAAGALAAGGVLSVEVIKKPVVGIIPTGDEIVPPAETLQKGEIAEFNSVIFSGMLKKWGAEPKTYPIVKDKPELIENALKRAASECDIVIINAGSSAGRGDFSASSISKLGKVIFHGIALKPGKPAILGIIGRVPVIGVPGYPVSGIIVLEEIVRPVIDEIYARDCLYETADAVLTRRLTSPLKYREFIRAKLGRVGGRLVAVPLSRGSGVVTSFVKADALIDIPQNSEGIEPGDKVRVRLLRPMSEIEKTLVVTGSHDPLIDEAADILRRSFPDAFTAASHVGSMGGVMAVKRGEAHMAGVHLLDRETGEYNTQAVKLHFPNGGATLYPCVKRVQGFIVPKGNPLGISGWMDIAERGLSYVNRQNGSGTRILCDYLLKSQGILDSQIYGYEREEFTHTNVAAIIAAGSADVGLGIYSAAKIYGLDFIPVCEEQYDMLVLDSALETEPVRRFLDVLAGAELRVRLESMGGYAF